MKGFSCKLAYTPRDVSVSGMPTGAQRFAPSPSAWAHPRGLPNGEGRGAGGGGGAVVSMLMPTRRGGAAGAEGRNLTAMDTMYVVILEPGASYATYSCRLPHPVLV